MSTWDASSESRLIVDETILSEVPTYISPVMNPPDFSDTAFEIFRKKNVEKGF